MSRPWEKHVIVHADDARQHSVTVEIESLGVGWYSDGSRWSQRLDLAATDDDRLIFDGRRAGAVDDANAR